MRNLTISTSVRPGRVAVLVDAKDPAWQSTCLRVVEYFTRMWGGSGNIIIPTDGKEIRPLFWEILERFDPDYVEAYRRTGQDLELEEPAKFEEAYKRHIAAWERETGGRTETHAADAIREQLRDSELAPFAISEELQRQLKERLAPFHFQETVVEAGSVICGSVPQHPHTDIIDILPYVEHSHRLMKVKGGAVFPQLWWASSFGSANAELEAQLAGREVTAFDCGNTTEETRLLVGVAIKGYEAINSAPFLANTSARAIEEILRSAPARLSMAGLGYFRSTRHHRWADTVVAVAGTSAEDFALYYALSRMRTLVVWIPPPLSAEWLDGPSASRSVDERFHFVNDLASLARETPQRHGGLRIISATLSDEQLDEIRSGLAEISVGRIDQCQTGRAEHAIPALPIRHYEAKNASLLRSIAVPDDGVIPLFETPLPKSFETVDPGKHRWLTELHIGQYHLPRHHALGEWVVGTPSSQEGRISSEGPTYFCPNSLILSGATTEASVPRPSIRIPEPLEIFKEVAGASELVCAVSDKGFYAESSCKKFGGLGPLAEFLRSETGRSLVSAFLDKAKPEEGEHLKGAMLGGRRYLDLDSLTCALGNEDKAAQMLDRLSSSAVLYRGLVLQCEYCRRADWFTLRELSDAFTCKRCHREQIFTSKHWRYPNQPRLYYQLDELVYLGLEHNMHVPLLALDALRRASQDSFLYAHEIEYRVRDSDAPPSEIDLNCVIDGDLTIGEAKKEDRLGRNEKEEVDAISKYRNLAGKIAARRIVFATCQEQWSSTTIARIKNAFADQRFRLTLLTKKDLYA